MIRWLLYLVPAYIITLLCLITNPIVVLFCDEEGELPFPLSLWQTWDDSCDSAFFMDNVCPAWLHYGYRNKYDALCVNLLDGRNRLYSRLKPNATFTVKERIQRYFCRVLWLMRNPAYGFMYHVFGADCNGAGMKYTQLTAEYKYGTDGKHFVYKNDKKIVGRLYWKIFIGWKIGNVRMPHRCMYAYRLWFDIK